MGFRFAGMAGGWGKCALAVVVLAALMVQDRPAHAMITLQETVEPINSDLQAEGWMGVKLTLVTDGPGVTISAMDFKNDVALQWHPETQTYTWEFPQGEAIGISGPVYQAWNLIKKATVPTPSGQFSDSSDSDDRVDSYFINTGIISTLDPFTEDNDLSVGDGEGIGSYMTFSGGIHVPVSAVDNGHRVFNCPGE